MNVGDLLFKPVVGNQFLVTIFIYSEMLSVSNLPPTRIPSPLDLRFQRVSGLGGSLSITSHRQGGDNVVGIDLPDAVQRDRLVLERGIMTVTPFSLIFSEMLNDGKPVRCDIIIMLLGPQEPIPLGVVPLASWCVTGAVPINWSVGEFDASTSTVPINRFEFSYHRIQWLGIKQ